MLKEQFDSLNHNDNNYLFGSYFESEFSETVNSKQKLKYLFTELKKVNYNSGAECSGGPNHILPQAFQGSFFPQSPGSS